LTIRSLSVINGRLPLQQAFLNPAMGAKTDDDIFGEGGVPYREEKSR